MKPIISTAIYLLLGALVYQWIFGDPDFSRVGTWGVMVFWPFVLMWYGILWTLLICVVVCACVYVHETSTATRLRRRIAAVFGKGR